MNEDDEPYGGHEGRWIEIPGVTDADGTPAFAHVLCDPDITPAELALIQKIALAAYKAVQRGEIGKKKGREGT